MAPTTRDARRITSLDIVRGIVMILMAIDHVRVYSGVPAGGASAAIFFTRWVTNFSAPAFAFFAGTGAFLLGRKLGDSRALSRYLLTRGLMLVALELTIVRLSWTFNLDFAHYNLAGVIWMLGWCMVLLAALHRLPLRIMAVLGVLVIVGQQVFVRVASLLPAPIGQSLYLGQGFRVGPHGPPVAILYVIVPWIAVMLLGFAFGTVMTRDEGVRRRWCLQIGLGATAVFAIIATIQTFQRSAAGRTPPLFVMILGQQKYPPSAMFLLMTMGPTIAFIPVAERMRGWVADVLATFGRVPLFYYVLHIPLIHALALGVSLVREGRIDPWLFANHPYAPGKVPDGYMWSLPLLYLIFAVAILLLYPACRWFARLKESRRTGWTTYF